MVSARRSDPRWLARCVRHLAIALLSASLAGTSLAATPYVDILFVYTKGAKQAYPGAIETRINHMVSVTNRIFADSGSDTRIRSVFNKQINYSDSAATGEALDDIAFGRGLFSKVEGIREKVGADMVVLLRPYANDGLCGMAYLAGIGKDGDFTGYSHWMYSHVSIDCSDYVLAHELGHNMGLAHSRRQDPEGGSFHYSTGHGVDGSFVTVMAYGDTFSASKIYKMSSPDIRCFDQPCGVPESDDSNGADAVTSLAASVPQIADYFDSEQGRVGMAGDFDGDGRDDLFVRNPETGENSIWMSAGMAAEQWSAIDDELDLNTLAVGVGDFDGDGRDDILWRNRGSGANTIWFMNGISVSAKTQLASPGGGSWRVAAVADMDGDFRDDIVWHNVDSGENAIWNMNGVVETRNAIDSSGRREILAAVADFDGDGKRDLFFRNPRRGRNRIWFMDNATRLRDERATGFSSRWRVVLAQDFNRDGKADLLIRRGGSGRYQVLAMDGARVRKNWDLLRTSGRAWLSFGMPDLDGDGDGDLVFGDARSDATHVFHMASGRVTRHTQLGSSVDLDLRLVGVGDANGDGREDVFWRRASGVDGQFWGMDGTSASESDFDSLNGDWVNVGTGDFDGDGSEDLLWRNSRTGRNEIWFMQGGSPIAKARTARMRNSRWQVAGTGDFDGDNKDDIVWRQRDGDLVLWLMDGAAVSTEQDYAGIPAAWQLSLVADFTGDGMADLMWRHESGSNLLWQMNAAVPVRIDEVASMPDPAWRMVAAGDCDGDGRSDIIWRHSTTGANALWMMDGARVTSQDALTTESDLGWKLLGAGDFDADSKSDILWRHAITGEAKLWKMDGSIEVSETALN